MRNNNRLRKYVPSLLLFLLFETVAVALWLAKGNLFYLLDFSYIGGCLGVGTALFAAGKRYARQFVQWAVGSYMLLYLGVLSHENMQIEGFWYYLFLGVFEAATIHYAVAKIFGPLVFGRGVVRIRLLDSHGSGSSALQNTAGTEEKAGVLSIHHLCIILCLCGGTFFVARRKHGKDPVCLFSCWKYPVLCGWHCAGIPMQRQPCLLQVSLPGNGLFEAYELFFPAQGNVR